MGKLGEFYNKAMDWIALNQHKALLYAFAIGAFVILIVMMVE